MTSWNVDVRLVGTAVEGTVAARRARSTEADDVLDEVVARLAAADRQDVVAVRCGATAREAFRVSKQRAFRRGAVDDARPSLRVG
jgi:hypothetical protein